MIKNQRTKIIAPFIESLKRKLVELGPNNVITQLFLKAHAYLHGYRIAFKNKTIVINKGNRDLILNEKELISAPIMIERFDDFFNQIGSHFINNHETLDFSKPAIHRYSKSGIELLFPNTPNDDSIEAYTYKFKPSEGMIVFDVGAFAGFTTYFFSLLVGDKGKVYAFEPDDQNRNYLNENIKSKKLDNVIVLDLALGSESARAMMSMEGSMTSSLKESSLYPNAGIQKEVSVVTLEDFCKQKGVIPNFIKMDIEGAEVGVIENSLEFLKKHPIHFAFDSYHRTKNGTLTYLILEKLFSSIGYSVISSPQFGEMFTWATPPAKKNH